MNHRDSFGVLEQPQEICQLLPFPHTIFLQNSVDGIQFSVVSLLSRDRVDLASSFFTGALIHSQRFQHLSS